jgi:hypothetical protein
VDPYIVISAALMLLGLTAMSASLSRVIRLRTVDGISMATTVMNIWISSYWLSHGIHRAELVQIVNNSACLLMLAVMLIVGRREGSFRPQPALLATLAFAAVMFVAHQVGDTAVMCLVFAVQISMTWPQLRASWRNPGGRGLSVVALSVGLSNCAGWITFGVLRADPLVVATASYALAHTLFVLGRTVQGRRRQAAVAPRSYVQMAHRDEAPAPFEVARAT